MNEGATPEATPESMAETQRPWAPLRGGSKLGKMKKKMKQKNVHNEERQNW